MISKSSLFDLRTLKQCMKNRPLKVDFSKQIDININGNAWSIDPICGCVHQANGIIKKLQGDLKALVGKIKVKNTVTVSQEKVLQETTERLQREQRELQDTQHRLRLKEDEVNTFSINLNLFIREDFAFCAGGLHSNFRVHWKSKQPMRQSLCRCFKHTSVTWPVGSSTPFPSLVSNV